MHPVLCQPAVGAVLDRCADHETAVHRVADQVIVQGIAAQMPLLVEVTELGVADGSGRVCVIHRVPTFPFRISGLNDDTPAQIGHLSSGGAFRLMLKLQRRAEGQLGVADGLDDALFGFGRVLLARRILVGGRGDDDPVAGFPAAYRLRQRDHLVPLPGSRAELDPGAAQGGAMEVHPPATANDRRARLPVQPLDSRQADEGGVLRRNRSVCRANFQRRPGRPRFRFDGVGVAVNAMLAAVVPGLDLDQAHVQPCVAIPSKRQRAGDVDRADDLVRFQVVGDRVAGADLDPGASGWQLAPLLAPNGFHCPDGYPCATTE